MSSPVSRETTGPSVIPPDWWVEQLNEVRAENGAPPVNRLDAIATGLWWLAVQPVPQRMFVLTSCA